MAQATGVLLIEDLVEDDEDDFVVIKEMLTESRQSDYSLACADTYECVKDSLATSNYDICILDYRLGACDGLDLLREITKANDRTPVIMLTGQDDYDIDMVAMNTWASDYLVKGGIDSVQSERSIRYALAQGKLQEQIRESSRLISLGALAAGMAHEVVTR